MCAFFYCIKMKTAVVFLFLFVLEFSYAQNKNINWCFGDSAGINFSNLNAPTTFKSAVKSRGSCASISDTAGNLLFYYAYDQSALLGGSLYNGNVYSINNQLMVNGDKIVSGAWYYEGLIIPIPNETNKYFLFNLGVTENFGLCYSIIDMSLNNGLGAVTQKNIQINNLPANDGLAAAQHGNGRDWWLIFKDNDGVADNTFYKYLVDTSGVALADTQNIGSYANTNTIRLKFNKEGTQLATVNFNGVTDLFDFDRCTGKLTNYQLIKSFTFPPNAEFVSAEFSSSGRFLYISSNGYSHPAYLIQIDLQNPQLYLAADTIDSITNLISAGGFLKRGPDDKIYWSCAWIDSIGTFNYPYPDTPAAYNMYNMNLSVINAPDSLGAACNFTPYSFYLGGARTYWGLPNNPDYDLGPLKVSPCDTLSVNLTPALSKGEGAMQITYVVAWEKLFVNASGLKGKNVTVSIYDGRGSLMFEVQSLKAVNGYFTLDLDCSGWAGGLYVVHLGTEREVLSKKFIIE